MISNRSVWNDIFYAYPGFLETTITAPYTFKAVIQEDKVPKIKQLIYCPPATIVFWEDGDKTVVKCENEDFSEEHGLAMAYMRKIYPSRAAFKKVIANAHHIQKKEPKQAEEVNESVQ